MFAQAWPAVKPPCLRWRHSSLTVSWSVNVFLFVQLSLHSQDGGHMLRHKQRRNGRKAADEIHLVPTSPAAAADGPRVFLRLRQVSCPYGLLPVLWPHPLQPAVLGLDVQHMHARLKSSHINYCPCWCFCFYVSCKNRLGMNKNEVVMIHHHHIFVLSTLLTISFVIYNA